ncbi:hypothetical protein O3P69_015863 [Scylla paramamosain]|uniref:Uncharacterized protein n=1 Tax=Scylla paramamosain TaxID=85552 RepID=A0AAW0T8L1_SCYPA
MLLLLLQQEQHTMTEAAATHTHMTITPNTSPLIGRQMLLTHTLDGNDSHLLPWGGHTNMMLTGTHTNPPSMPQEVWWGAGGLKRGAGHGEASVSDR